MRTCLDFLDSGCVPLEDAGLAPHTRDPTHWTRTQYQTMYRWRFSPKSSPLRQLSQGCIHSSDASRGRFESLENIASDTWAHRAPHRWNQFIPPFRTRCSPRHEGSASSAVEALKYFVSSGSQAFTAVSITRDLVQRLFVFQS